MTVLSLSSPHAQSRVTELNEQGWKALRGGYSDRAAALFAEALTLRPNDPVLLMGSGAAAHAQGKQRDAMARLQRALDGWRRDAKVHHSFEDRRYDRLGVLFEGRAQEALARQARRIGEA